MTETESPAILIAIGNTVRRDDGVAHRVLELLGPVPALVTRDVQQLVPEMAEEIAPAETVIFIDADIQPGEPRLEPLSPKPEARCPLGHAMTPNELVALSRSLYGFRGNAYLCRVPGLDFSEGESLTPEAEANARTAVELLRRVMSEHMQR